MRISDWSSDVCSSDLTQGEVVLAENTLLDFSHLTVAAAMNHPSLTVYRRPKIAILATGDELLVPGSVPAAGQIIASNTFGVGALIRDNGGEVLDLGIVPDLREEIVRAVDTARAAGADILVPLGGASVGDPELVPAESEDRRGGEAWVRRGNTRG